MSQKSPKKKTVKPRRKRYRNERFLNSLGDRCKKLRLQKGYSIDRLSKESNQLSPASIDRLEKGKSDTHILVLLRYVETLGSNLHDLFAYLKESKDISQDSRIIPYEEGLRPSSSYVPVYSIKVAAGKFAAESDLNEDQPPLGWIDVNLKGSAQDYFAAFVQGESMQPRITDGDLCLFRKYSGGSRQGKIFLIQARSLHDAETGEAFVVKKYMRQTPPRSPGSEKADTSESVIHLISENPRFSPIILYGLKDEEIQTIAEFVKVL